MKVQGYDEFNDCVTATHLRARAQTQVGVPCRVLLQVHCCYLLEMDGL